MNRQPLGIFFEVVELFLTARRMHLFVEFQQEALLHPLLSTVSVIVFVIQVMQRIK